MGGQDLPGAVQPAHLAVGAHHAVLELQIAAFQRATERGDHVVVIVRVQQRHPVLERAAELARREPVDDLEGGVPVHVARLGVPLPRAGAAGAERERQTRLGEVDWLDSPILEDVSLP